MNGMIDAVWDTNIVIGFLNGAEPVHRMSAMIGVPRIAVSQVTRMELLAKADVSVEEYLAINKFLYRVTVVPLIPNVESFAIQFRRDFQLRLPDAIVAATAKAQGCMLVTGNMELARKVRNVLRVINPFDIVEE